MGWRPGTFIGPTNSLKESLSRGILNPITTEGSLSPHVHTGLGYHGEKIWEKYPNNQSFPNSNSRLTSRKINSLTPIKTVYIRSVFDDSHYVSKRHQSMLGFKPGSIERPDPALVVKWLKDDQRDSKLTNKNENFIHKSSFVCPHRTIILNSSSSISKNGISFVFRGYLNDPRSFEK